MVLFDHSEYALYAILQELQSRQRLKLPRLNHCYFGVVTDKTRVEQLFKCARYGVSAARINMSRWLKIIYLKALCNLFGTLVLSEAAIAGVKKFVLISTDKAVRLTNIMGASKRLAEPVLGLFHNAK